MRYLTICSSVLWLLCAACSDDDATTDKQPDAGREPAASGTDAGNGRKDAGGMDGTAKDAGANSDAGSASASLRPALPRAPKNGLPPDLRPPR